MISCKMETAAVHRTFMQFSNLWECAWSIPPHVFGMCFINLFCLGNFNKFLMWFSNRLCKTLSGKVKAEILAFRAHKNVKKGNSGNILR